MELEEQASAIGRCQVLMTALEAWLGDVPAPRSRAWSDLGYPVIERNQQSSERKRHLVFPLLVADAAGDPAVAQDLGKITDALWLHWGYRYGGHDFRVGRFGENDEWGKQALGEKLRAAGASGRGPVWWDIGNHVVIWVNAADPEHRALTSALHVVPRDWIFAGLTTPSTDRARSRCRRVLREVTAADLRWDPRAYAAGPGDVWVTAPGPVDG